jgi:formamidopyrimidine-DNA glycosylase
MPELPDIAVYLQALEARVRGEALETVRLANPFLLRTVEPPLEALFGLRVGELRRIGKRIAFGFEGDLWLVLHLMIAGRLRWIPRSRVPVKIPGKIGLAAFDFSSGTLILTEAGSKRRASLHVVPGTVGIQALDPAGLEVLTATVEQFTAQLQKENHTLKRALCDPHLFSGIGNAYSDEILHRARLSPVTLTKKLSEDDVHRLYDAVRQTLVEWTERLAAEADGEFPTNVTAFRDGMAVHGRFGLPCPECGSPVQRIRYADNETNYCARCQTGGKVLADRSLSRLLKDDWPRDIHQWE